MPKSVKPTTYTPPDESVETPKAISERDVPNCRDHTSSPSELYLRIYASPQITADNTFTYCFESVVEEGIDTLEPMVRSSNYRVVVSYYENSGDFDT
ncbi:MAG TPA: hypothetical protein VHJ59_07895 [Nitrososphaera sp.]|nr:hypothetical protein [Nitrososphaera sp.]